MDKLLLDIQKKPSFGNGFVYLLCCVDKFKIGITKNSIAKRIQELQTGNSEEIWCRDYVECPLNILKDIEKAMHFRHHQTNIKNEWFDLSADDVSNFKQQVNKYIFVYHNITKMAGLESGLFPNLNTV